MSAMTMKNMTSMNRLFSLTAAAASLLLSAAAHAAAPGITGPVFNLIAQTAYISQPDGNALFLGLWLQRCARRIFPPAAPLVPNVSPSESMQVPGPTLIVTEGQTGHRHSQNNLPTPAGNTSILFPGIQVTAAGGVDGF